MLEPQGTASVFADCPFCQALEPNDQAPAALPKTLRDYALVMTYPGVVAETPFRHVVDRGGIVQQYIVEGAALVPCSLAGRHRHKSGAIVRTRCGLLIRLGHKCAERSVHGWTVAAELFKFLAGRADKQETLRNGAASARNARALFNRLDTLCTKLTDEWLLEGCVRWARYAWQRDRSIPSKVITVPEFRIGRNYQSGDEHIKLVQAEKRVAAQEFWAGWDDNDPGQKRRLSTTLQAVVTLEALVWAPISRFDDDELARRARDVEDASSVLAAQMAWCDLADVFFSGTNLQLLKEIHREHRPK